MYVLQERFIKFFFLKANYGSAKHLIDLGQLHEHPGRGVSMTTAVMPGLSWNSEESYMYYSNKNLQASRTIFHEQKLKSTYSSIYDCLSVISTVLFDYALTSYMQIL